MKRRQMMLSALAGVVSINKSLANEVKYKMNDNDEEMKLVYIHRSMENYSSERTKNGKEPTLSFKLKDGNFHFSFKIRFNGKIAEGMTSVDATPGSYYSFFYNIFEDSIQTTNLRTSDYVNVMVADGSKGYFIGRLLVTSREVIFAVNGRNEDVPGVINFERKRGEQVEDAIMRYSDEARLIIERIKERNALTREVDVLECISYLEAQVDLLTRIILDNKDINPSPCLELLKYADLFAVYRYEKENAIKERFTHKERMRKMQESLRRLEVNRKELDKVQGK